MIAAVLVFARRHRWSVLALTAVATTVFAILCTRVSFGTDVLALLPQQDPALRGLRQYLERFGTADQLYIVFDVPDGRQIDDSRALIDAYVGRLRGLTEITHVDTGLFDPARDWTYLQDRTFALIGPAATRQALDRLSDAGMREALLQSRELLAAPSPDVRALVQSDPLGFLSLIRDHFATAGTLTSLDVNRRGYISTDGRSQLVIATPAGPSFDNDFSRRLFERLATVEDGARQEASRDPDFSTRPAVTIGYAGGHRIAVETEAIIKREAILNSVTSVSAILVLLLIAFRSGWLFLVGAIPMTVATLGAIAINGLIHGQLSAAATGTSALLFGLGIDGLVLMYSRYLEEVESGVPPDAAIARLSGAGTSMLLGCLTTSATFFGLTWIDMPGLQELGRLVGLGMLLGGPLTLILVVALLPANIKRSRALSAAFLPGFVRRHQKTILIASAVATLVAVPLIASLDLDLRLQRLQPETSSVLLQRDLERRFGVDREVAVAVNDAHDLDTLLVRDRRFEAAVHAAAPALVISGPSRFLPPIAEQEETARMLASAVPDAAVLQARLRSAAEDVGFRAGALDDFIRRLPNILDPEQRLTYEGYVEHGLGDLIARFVARTPAGFTTAAYAEVTGAGDLAHVRTAAANPDVSATLTGVPVVNAALAGQFESQFLLALAAGSAAVFVLILVTFRTLTLTLLALAPTAIGLVWAAALLALTGIRLDLFSIFAVLTLIGIGVDYGIHLVHRATTEPGELDVALARVAPANIVAAGIALLGCGSLAASSYPPLRSLGLATVVGLCTCLVTSVLVLPALLMTMTRPRKAFEVRS